MNIRVHRYLARITAELLSIIIDNFNTWYRFKLMNNSFG